MQYEDPSRLLCKVVFFRAVAEVSFEVVELPEFTRHLSSQESTATVYGCRDYSCELPTTDVREMLSLLNAEQATEHTDIQ